jgi:hypothetical protein
MPEQQTQTKPAQISAPIQSDPASPKKPILIDTRRLAEALIEFNIARKNISIYPSTHAQVRLSVTRAHGMLCRLFRTTPEIKLGVAENRIIVDESIMDPKNPVYAQLAEAFKRHGIVTVSMQQGLTQDGLTRFLRLLTNTPETVQAKGGFANILCHKAFKGITVQTIDYGTFHLTPENKITRPPKQQKKSIPDGIWHDFASHLLTGTLANQKDPNVRAINTDISPQELAEILNAQVKETEVMQPSYEAVISHHLQMVSEQNQPTCEQTQALEKLNTLIADLHPDLRHQFLSTAFKQVNGPEPPAWAEDFLVGMSEEVIIEMLSQANDDGDEISPSLLSLVQRIFSTTGNDFPILANHQAHHNPELQEGLPVSEDIKQLFKREKYETYVISEYDQVLKSLSSASDTEKESPHPSFPLEAHLKTLGEDYLDFQIARVLLAFMDSPLEPAEYKDYARKLLGLVNGLMITGEFGLLYKIYKAFKGHEMTKPHTESRIIANKAWRHFHHDACINEAICAFDRHAAEKGDAVIRFMTALGASIVPPVITYLSQLPIQAETIHFYRLLGHFKNQAAEMALWSLGDDNPLVIQHMVRLLGQLDHRQATPQIKTLLDHEKMAVRRDALQSLVMFRDPWGLVFLKKWIRSPNEEESAAGIALAGEHKVMEMVPELTNRLQRIFFRKTTYRRNETIVNALSEIGDQYAIPMLDKLIHSIWPLMPKRLARLKQVVFRSLVGYPIESTLPLISAGLKSKDTEIRKICLDLIKRKDRD